MQTRDISAFPTDNSHKYPTDPAFAGASNGVHDADYIKKNAFLIEKNLEALGIFVKVKEINILDMFYEYYLDVAVGTNFSSLEKLDRELAAALSSPTGKVSWQIPVPGKTLVGLRVPKPPKEYFEEIEREKQRRWKENTLRNKIAFGFYLLGQFNYFIADKVLGNSKPAGEKQTKSEVS